jgi:ABC-2 type transport system permease protein
MYAVFRKELADHFNSKRFTILFLLTFLVGIFAVYVATQNIRSQVTADTVCIFLKLFTTTGEQMPLSFLFLISIFIPIIGIAFGFDAINSERASGNLSRLLSQPIYRDSVINGKFLAGLSVMGIMIVSVIGIVAGLGLYIIGVPPNSEEVMRLIVFAVISVIYGAFWMALSILFSVFFNRAATSMLASLGLWLFFFFFMQMISAAIADTQVPIDSNSSMAVIASHYGVQGMVARISPLTLYQESIAVLLIPELGSLNPALMMISLTSAGRMLTPLPLGQSLLLTWPQTVSIIALAAICFAISYLGFMRQEIRST